MNASNDPFYGAPAVLIVLADKVGSTTPVYDGSCVIENMMLAAHELGLATCWIHRAQQVMASDFGKEILASLGIDTEKYEGIGNVIIGYADGEPAAPAPRKENYVYWVE